MSTLKRRASDFCMSCNLLLDHCNCPWSCPECGRLDCICGVTLEDDGDQFSDDPFLPEDDDVPQHEVRADSDVVEGVREAAPVRDGGRQG